MTVKKTDAEEIIVEAMELFRKHGYRPTTMDSIGRACLLKKGSLYIISQAKKHSWERY